MAFPLTTEDYMSFLTELERRLGEDSMDKGGRESLVNFLTGLRFLLQSNESCWRIRSHVVRQRNDLRRTTDVTSRVF